MSTDLDTADTIRIVATGEVWQRVYGGRFDGLFTTDVGPTVPTHGGAYRSAHWLAQQGEIVVEARI